MDTSQTSKSKPHEFTLAEARLSRPPAERLLKHYSEPGLRRERARFYEFMEVDIAHAVMLARQGIIETATAAKLLKALLELQSQGPEGLPIDPSKGSFLLQVEADLSRKLGHHVAGQLHTGRSRIDQGATVRRLAERRTTLDAVAALMTFRRTLISMAEQHPTTVMPGYTHMQHAQPWVFGHYILSFASRTRDDFERLREAYGRMNLNPLGSVGLAGTSWPLDRALTTALLGFSDILENSKLAREAYYAAEVVAALSFVMADINDLATDLHVWSMSEIGIVECDDAFCGTSSIFPQKKNPVGLETIKKAAGPASLWLATALSTFRAEGTGDQSVRELALLEEAAATTTAMLELADAIVETLIVHEDRMKQLVNENWATSSHLADVIVRVTGLSFREVHHIVGRLIRKSIAAGVSPTEVTPEMIDASARETIGQDLSLEQSIISEALDPDGFISSRVTAGSVNPAEIRRMLDRERAALEEDVRWFETETARLKRCRDDLRREAESLIDFRDSS